MLLRLALADSHEKQGDSDRHEDDGRDESTASVPAMPISSPAAAVAGKMATMIENGDMATTISGARKLAQN